MNNPQPAAGPDRPAVHLIDTECEALSALALAHEHRQPALMAQLLAELDRAELHAAADLPPGTVTMGSTVEFVDEGNGMRRTVRLVYPSDADIEAGRVSILTPIGAGLIGLAAGDAISWPDRDGHMRQLRIVSVQAPAPETDAA